MTKRESLFAQLDRLHRGYVRGRSTVLAFAAITAVTSVLVTLALLDLFLRFHPALCWFAWLLLVATAVAGIAVTVRMARTRMSHSAMAVLAERVLPGMENHLINAVQFTERQQRDPAFVEALLDEVDPRLDTVKPAQLYSPKPLKWTLRIAGAALAVACIAFAVRPRGMAHAVARLVLPIAGIQPYTQTRILTVTPGNVTRLRGEPLDITVRLAGYIPGSPHVEWERDSETADIIDLHKPEESARTPVAFSCGLKGVFHTSRYRVVAGDARSRWYTVDVTSPPGLEHWEAKIVPPDYVNRESYRLDSTAEDMGVPEGSTVILAGAASTPLQQATVIQDEIALASKEAVGRTKFGIRFDIRNGGAVRLRLTADSGLESTNTLPLAVLPDQRPTVQLLDTKQRIMAATDAQIPVSFKAEDDYGVTRVGFERLLEENRVEPISAVDAQTASHTFPGRFLVDMASFGAREGDTFRFRVWAEDNGGDRENRRGLSPVIQITVPVLEDRRNAKKKVVDATKDRLVQLVKMQRDNLKNTRVLSDLAALGKEVSSPQIQEVQIPQNTIRDLARSLLQDRAALGDLANTLAGLVNNEMTDVLEVFEEVHRSGKNEMPEKLAECVRLETRILAQLTGIPMGLENEQQHQDKTDLFAALQKIITAQRTNLKDSKEAQTGTMSAQVTALLAANQDRVANDIVGFTDLCLVMVEGRVDDDFATQIRKVYDLVENGSVYEKALGAAESLEEGDFAAGIQYQEEVLKTLMQALNVLNQWRMRNAQKIVKEATEVLKKTAEKLDELEAKQARIAEVTRDLTTRGKIDDEVREKLAEMDEEQKDMANLVEELANDLYQFPELPVCNELNSKMREIFEDVEQAMESENAPAIEIAVQKEDSLLDAIRKTKERIEDVEMWLPDIPDNIVWNMESFDTDEFPDMPLVPLPDELEDIVGDLLDQASDIDAQSQDSTGNNMIADMEMGWGVMDGPMPCFSAKGKSGNTRPNDNEMTGRSGAGREGQSNGELVENHVKGLEGRKTHARRTQDPFQNGMVTEDEDSTMDARSTGGGKLGGESESIGMFGKAPRRDLHTPDHGTGPTQLRQETEALYATARLLYLGTGSLGTAARELRGVESAAKKMRDFGSLHRRVLRRLEDTQVELNSGVVLPMPVTSVSKTGGAATDDVDVSKISEEYRDIVSDYYRSLETE